MSSYQVTVDSKTNSIAKDVGTGVGGTPAKVTFVDTSSTTTPPPKKPLKAGDVLTIQTQITETWSSGGGPGQTNADGVTVSVTPDGLASIDWSSFNPGSPDSTVVTAYPVASSYSFGVGCLIGSLDSGKSFFPIGTSFTTTILGNGLLSNDKPSIPELWLFYWDVNAGDNTGSITFTVSVTRRAE